MRSVSQCSLTFNCGWRMPGEGAAPRSGAQKSTGMAAGFGEPWVPASGSNDNGVTYVRLVARARS